MTNFTINQHSKNIYSTATVFTTLHFLLNLRIGPVSYSVTSHKTKILSIDKHSSLLGAFVSYEDNEVL